MVVNTVPPLDYHRQGVVFPEPIRTETSLNIVNAEANPQLLRWLVAGAASMGVPDIAADSPGVCRSGRGTLEHWFRADCDRLVRTVNPGPRFRWLQGGFGDDGEPHRENRCVVVFLNDADRARDLLSRSADRTSPCIGVACTECGVLVWRFGSLEECLAALSFDLPAAKPCQWLYAALAAGLVLDTMMRTAASGPGLVACYCPDLPCRVRISSGARLCDCFAFVVGNALSGSGAFSLRGRRLLVIGAGALGNAVAPLFGVYGVHQVICDDDIVEPGQRRQLFLVRGIGESKAPVLCREINALTGCELCTPVPERIEDPVRLERLARDAAVDAIVCVPDNDAVRYLAARVAARLGLPCAVAGSSGVGGQAITCVPGSTACYECTVGNPADAADDAAQPESCADAADDAVVSCNLVAGSLLVLELGLALAGRRPQNLRFMGDVDTGNRIVRMPTPATCGHWHLATMEGDSR